MSEPRTPPPPALRPQTVIEGITLHMRHGVLPQMRVLPKKGTIVSQNLLLKCLQSPV